MNKYVHIVQVHPVELGLPNLVKVVDEREFLTEAEAKEWIEVYNLNPKPDRHGYPTKAVYFGRVNDITGEVK